MKVGSRQIPDAELEAIRSAAEALDTYEVERFLRNHQNRTVEELSEQIVGDLLGTVDIATALARAEDGVTYKLAIGRAIKELMALDDDEGTVHPTINGLRHALGLGPAAGNSIEGWYDSDRDELPGEEEGK